MDSKIYEQGEKAQPIVLDKAVLVEKIMEASHLTWDEAANALEITLERLREDGKVI